MGQPISYIGELCRNETSTEFAIKTQVAFRSEAEARQFGDWLHKAINDHVAGNGGMLQTIIPKMPTPNSFLYKPNGGFLVNR